ncbi:hypothetical protein [Carboxylicivirga marina]|uniref:hypothetical protein n=1 Tax=Carboxylicivirga marina TaxID=2800988 RepID=UPI0025945409|nr:hypothetical protein [uncultured Carboxylicivirga sp.]
MNENTLLLDLITYFGKFPIKEGVLKLFNRNATLPGYDELKQVINNMETHSLVPDIKDFACGVNEQVLKKQINNFSGIYLFIDYGAIAIDKDEIQRENGSFNIGVTVAVPFDHENRDAIESMLLAQQTLNLLIAIREKMKGDQKCGVAWMKDLTFPHDISPWEHKDLNNSTGWTMLFTKKGINII